MDRIENWIVEKYFDNDYDRCRKYMSLYLKIKDTISYVPETIASTYLCIRFPLLKYSWNRKKFFQRSCWYWQIRGGGEGLWKREEGEPTLRGWRKAFGIQLCKELKAALKRGGMLKTWEITTVKEKFGALCIYDNGATEEVHDILNKYEYISSRTCVECGRPAKYRTQGWIEPYCEDCVKKLNTIARLNKYYEDFDWYGWTK
jgi:hypothetical protein